MKGICGSGRGRWRECAQQEHAATPGRVLNATDGGLHRVEYIGTLVYDPFNNMIWIANSGLYVYDLKRDELKLAFTEAMKVKGALGAVVSPNGRLWICCLEGLFIVDLKGSHGSGEFSYSHHPNKLDAPNVNVREKLTCVAIAHDGTVWVRPTATECIGAR